MALRTDAVDGNALRHPLVDVVDHTLGYLRVVGNVEVVVVDVQLGVGVGGAGGAESDADEILAEDTAEDTVSEVAVFSEDLVDDIPLENLALVLCDELGHVVLNDGGQCVAVADVLNPLGQLGVPEESVTPDELAVLLGEVDDGVGVAERERSTGGCIERVSLVLCIGWQAA